MQAAGRIDVRVHRGERGRPPTLAARKALRPGDALASEAQKVVGVSAAVPAHPYVIYIPPIPPINKICRLGRKSSEHGVDRTPYKGDRKISFVSYNTRAISMNIVRATAWTLHDAPRKKLSKGRLCGKRAGGPVALG